MRVAAILLPELCIEVARRENDVLTGPLAVVVAERGGVVQCERDLLGNTRLHNVSREAHAEGVRVGQTVAAARAKCSDLFVRVVRRESVSRALADMAAVCATFGTTVGFRLRGPTSSFLPDVIWVDVTGCGHLHGDGAQGEARLADELVSAMRALGHRARVTIADGARVAAAVARWGKETVVAPGENRASLSPLPIEALPLEPDDIRWLSRLGIRRIDALRAVPKRSLGLRLGDRAIDVMSLFEGEDRAPIVAYPVPTVLEASAELEYGIEARDALVFVVKGLCARVADRLRAEWRAALRLELVCHYDKALVTGDDEIRLPIALPVPLADADALFAVMRARLESFTAEAPMLRVVLRVPEKSVRAPKPLDLFVPEAKAEQALPRIVAELVAELGSDRVGVLALGNTWDIATRSKFVALPMAPPVWPDTKHGILPALVSRAPEPTRLCPPVRFGSAAVAPQRHLYRVGGTNWWSSASLEPRRDFWSAWISSASAFAFVEQRGRDAWWLHGWMD